MQIRRLRKFAAPVAAMFALSACGSLNSLKQTFLGGPPESQGAGPERLAGFIGVAVADEPQAAQVGRDVLALGGNAADAAVAVGFTMAVTLPSRAGLGAGGACLAYSPAKNGPGAGRPEAVLFLPTGGKTAGGDRAASVPMLARGLYALHARYGKQPFESLLAGAERFARFGVPASRALVRDLTLVAGPLSLDPGSRAVFAPAGRPLGEGSMLQQPDLGATLSQLRTAGVGDLYQGALARRMVDASALAGGPLTMDELRAALPRTGAPLTVQAGRDLVAFLPPPADGGLAAAAAFQVLRANPGDTSGAQARAVGTVLRWRAGGGDAQAILASGASGGVLPVLPASAGFTVLDRDGNAVTCVTTMDNLFGTGRIAPGTGVLLGAAPAAKGLPLLAAALAYNSNLNGFRAAVAGSGQDGAALAVGLAMANALRTGQAMAVPVPEPGRADVISCARYLPDSEGSCTWAVDPRGAGLASASN